MAIDIKSLANSSVLQLQLYQQGTPIEKVRRELGITNIIKLAGNENVLGPSPLAFQAAQKALKNVNSYPDGSGYELKHILAKYLTISPAQLTLGNGSDNVLAIIAHAFVKAGEEIIISEYAFATFTIIAHVAQAKPVFAPTKEWRTDLSALAKLINPQTRLIFIANPNNPTGTYNTQAEFSKFLKIVPENVIIVVDEAYFEYVTVNNYPNTLSLLKKHPNLVITRTFSKIYGLAGLRVGYGISSIEMAEILNRVRLPFNVNSVGLAAAAAAIDDTQHVNRSLQLIQQGKQQLDSELTKLKLKYIPTTANFITIDIKQDCLTIYQKLLHKGVIIRPLANYNMPTFIRVTIGTKEQNTRFIAALKKVL